MRRALAAALVSAGCTLLGSATATACVVAGGGSEVATLTLDDLEGRFTTLRPRLAKGLSITLLHRVRDADGHTFSFGCKVMYDLWDEAYVVTPLVGSVVVQQKTERLSSLAALPMACRSVRLPWKVLAGASVEVETALDPISAEQAEMTRKWLAERGVGAAGVGAGFGRAALSLVELRPTEALTRPCVARGSPTQ